MAVEKKTADPPAGATPAGSRDQPLVTVNPLAPALLPIDGVEVADGAKAPAAVGLAPTTAKLWLAPYRTLLSAAAAGTCGVVIGYPFDFVKTRMQTHGFTTMAEVVQTTIKYEGVHGFFRGMIPPLFSVSAVKAFSFQGYEWSKAQLARYHPERSVVGHEPMTDIALAGFCAGMATAFVSSPLELVKVQMQLNALMNRLDASSPVFRGSLHCIRHILQRHGIRGLYRGFSPHFMRDSFGTALYFWLYEGMHRVYSPTGRRSDAPPLVHFLAGGFAGVGCWMVIFPVDLIKSRIQRDACLPSPVYRGLVDCVRSIHQTYGFRAFYSGLRPTLVRAFPIHSVNFLVYEAVMRWLS